MASLSTVVGIRELGYEILQYLNPSDIFSLLLTCKLFYPVCYQSLWSTLRLYDRAKINDRGRICYKLARLIKARGVDNTGIEHIRTILLHRYSLTCTNGFVKSSFIHILEDLLASGKLNLKHLELRYNLSWHTDSEKEELFGFLRSVREYSQRKQPDEFSMAVIANPIFLEPGLNIQALDLEKITSLDLEMDWQYKGSENDELPRSYGAWGDSDSDLTDSGDDVNDLEGEDEETGWSLPISDQPGASDGLRPPNVQIDTSQYNTRLARILTHLLSRSINLRSLVIRSMRDSGRRYTDFKLSPPLEALRGAIENLPKLHTLAIQGKFFHPSFFITPPENTKVVTYDGVLSNKWLRGFRECPFPNVTHLNITFRKDTLERGRACRDFRRRPVNYIRVSGLLRCDIDGLETMATDVGSCILRGNRKLDELSRKKLSRYVDRPI